MRLTKWFALLAVAAGAVTLPSPAAAEGWFSDLDNAKEVTLGDLVRDPGSYIDVPVKVKVYFDSTASNYNPFYTRFSNNIYFNFAAWPINARLYDRRDFRRSYPFFFVQKVGRKWNKTAALKRVTAVELTCVVRDVFRGQPWIEVMDYDTLRVGLTLDDVKNVVAGDAYTMAGRHKEAVERYEKVARSRLPDNVRAEVYRKLADAYFQTGKYAKSEDAYEEALEVAPESPVLKQGRTAARDMKERGRWDSVAKKRAHIQVEIAPFHVPAVSHRTDIDVIIEATEDPEKVRREVEAHRLAVERRVGYLRPAAAVKGTPADKVQAKQAAVGEDEVVVKDGKIEGEEGCGTETAEESDEQVVVEGEVVESGDKAEENSEGCGDTVVEEQPAEEQADEAVEENAEEQPAEEQADEAVEENADEQPAEEQAEEVVEEPAEEEEPVVIPVPVVIPGAVEGDANQGDSELVETAEEPEDEMTETVVLVKDNELREGEVLVVKGEPRIVEKQAAVVEEQDNAVEGNEDAGQEGVEADENADEQPAEDQADEAVEEGLVDEQPAEEQAEEVVEEGLVDEQPAEEQAEEAVEEGLVDEQADEAEADEGCGEQAGEEQTDEPSSADDGDGEKAMVRMVGKDRIAVVVAGPQPAVVKSLPRLPFFGCEAVTAKGWREIIAEILKSPEQL